MAKEAFVAKLPLFDHTSLVTAALDDPEIAARGAVVSRDGSEYRIHRLKDLSAARSKHGDSTTFARLKEQGLLLRHSSVAHAKEAGFILTFPSSTTVDAANRAFQAGLGIAAGLENLHGRTIAWVFTHATGNFVLGGSSYVCSKYGENNYDEDDYAANGGMCPRHKGSTLVKKS